MSGEQRPDYLCWLIIFARKATVAMDVAGVSRVLILNTQVGSQIGDLPRTTRRLSERSKQPGHGCALTD
ncbi:MAG TPA: hypothetical protein VHH12_03710 [Mycobacterium sp.]|nr:hypothetical protein [Mycobacterium sp.]